ncbi:protein NETWORKED 3A-like [Durio zibethinus]|uniref:Protein NETWORKED 3A-like n=1 Tax=Durio zibethinus TaxID=66656 RepID=A0A6P5ZD77_DURZI|nr:protein NETWORKED 3A-like [Durio zibethinus]
MENSTASSSSPATPQQSQWLHTTLLDLDEKMKAMMTLLEEDDKSSCQNAHVSLNRKQELVQMLGELNRSYSSLLHKYDQLRSKSQNPSHSGSSSLSSNSTEIQHATSNRRVLEASDDPIWEASKFVLDDPDHFQHYRSNFEYLNKLADDHLILTEQCNMSSMRNHEQTNGEFSDEEDVVLKMSGFQRFNPEAAEFQKGGFESENKWFQLKFQFTKLMEDNLRQQAELLRRNDEKRQTINGLRLQLQHLKSENKTLLQKCPHCSKIGEKYNYSQTSRSTGLFLGKFFQGRCS